MSIIRKSLNMLFLISCLGLTSFVGEVSHQKSVKHILSGKILNPVQSIVHKTVLDNHNGLLEFEAQLEVSSFTVTKIHYHWILPKNVQLVSGSLDGDIDNLAPDVGQIIRIQTQGFNLEVNENTVLVIERMQGDQKLANHFIVPSREDLTEEYQKFPQTEDVNKLNNVNSISKIRNLSSSSGITKKIIY